MSDTSQFGPEGESESRNEIGLGIDPVHAELNSDYGEPTLGGESFGVPAPEAATKPTPTPTPDIVWVRPVIRTPNMADAGLFLVMLVLGWLLTAATLGLALYFHTLDRWFGIKDFQTAANDTLVALGTQLLIYLVALCVAIPFFRKVWGKGYFTGLHWHAATAWRLRYRLIVTALLCNGIAMVGNAVLPFPQHAPIDKMFSTTRDAWLLMSFGVLLAPLFEEMIFRGFLLPALATAWDWSLEKMSHTAPRQLDANGHPEWSIGAKIFAALVVSVPFAWMHSAQVGAAWGPISLLYCVSLILCTVRLVTRSLAASTFVHATYNLMLFGVMLAQTDGFRHLDKL